jgi:hypothetical protein
MFQTINLNISHVIIVASRSPWRWQGAAAPSTKGKTVFGKSALLGTENHRFLVMDQSRYANQQANAESASAREFKEPNRTGRTDKNH